MIAIQAIRVLCNNHQKSFAHIPWSRNRSFQNQHKHGCVYAVNISNIKWCWTLLTGRRWRHEWCHSIRVIWSVVRFESYRCVYRITGFKTTRILLPCDDTTIDCFVVIPYPLSPDTNKSKKVIFRWQDGPSCIWQVGVGSIIVKFTNKQFTNFSILVRKLRNL